MSGATAAGCSPGVGVRVTPLSNGAGVSGRGVSSIAEGPPIRASRRQRGPIVSSKISSRSSHAVDALRGRFSASLARSAMTQSASAGSSDGFSVRGAAGSSLRTRSRIAIGTSPPLIGGRPQSIS